MILDVPGAAADLHLAFELTEQHLWVLTENVHQNIQSTAVGHANDRLAHGLPAGALDQLVQQRDEIFAALQRESLLTDVLTVQIVLEFSRRGHPMENVAFLVGIEARSSPSELQALLDPALLLGRGDVGELGADVAAVRFAQQGVDLPERGLGALHVHGAGVENSTHVGIGEAVVLGFSVGHRWTLVEFQRVELRLAMAAIANRAD